jgi:ABC-type polysaccharide transport system permease subunit
LIYFILFRNGALYTAQMAFKDFQALQGSGQPFRTTQVKFILSAFGDEIADKGILNGVVR